MGVMSNAILAAGLLLGLCGASLEARAADRCRPLLPLSPPQPLEVASDEAGTPVWLEAVVAQPLTLSLSPGSLGLAADGRMKLAREFVVRGQTVGRGVLKGDQGLLVADAKQGSILMRAGARRVIADVVDREVRDASGQRLVVAPNLEGRDDFLIGVGAEVRALGNQQVVVESGSVLSWRPQPGQPLKVYLATSARLAETTASDAGHVSKLTPAFAPANGKLRVTLDGAGIDLRTHVPAFCFVGGKGASINASAQFVSQEGDRAVYDLRISREAADTLRAERDLWERIRGVPARLRVLAYVENQPAVDQWLDVRISSVGWSATVGGALLVLLTLVCALFMRKLDPRDVVGELIRQPSGRYSLSNLQVMLWSLLVLFALTFAWISTGELIVLSNDVLAMLGIVGGSSVLARGVEKLDPAAPAATAAPVEPDKSNLVTDKDGNFDLLRFQMLGFTLFSLMYSLVSVLRSDGLPELPQSLYWLMGVSNATYVLGKVPDIMSSSSDKSATTGSAAVGADLPKDKLVSLQKALGVLETGVLDAATRDAVAAYKLKNSLYPVNGDANKPLLVRLGI
jgi:hypothetical protein